MDYKNQVYEHIKSEMIKNSNQKSKIQIKMMQKIYDNFDYHCEVSNNLLRHLTLTDIDDIFNNICEECHFDNLYYEISAPNFCLIWYNKTYC